MATWPSMVRARATIERWEPVVGDRGTELVIIGINMDAHARNAIERTLRRCLVEPSEYKTEKSMADLFERWGYEPDPIMGSFYDTLVQTRLVFSTPEPSTDTRKDEGSQSNSLASEDQMLT